RFLPGPVPRENAGAGLRGSTREFLARKLARLADSRARGAFAAPMWREDRAARSVNHQIARDGEEPGLEFGFGVVLVAALQDAHPGFLEEIFGERGVAGEEK